MEYKVKIAEFEGPFDLILFFIERDELNIYDIPIAKLTNDFLEYIQQMQELNIELASEFILITATLMRIKAKTLLPRKDLNEAGEEIDPRDELVQKLLEYKRFKDIVEDLKNLETERASRHHRKSMKSESLQIINQYTTELELESVNLFKLMKVFNRVMNKHEARLNAPEHKVIRYPYTIIEQRASILDHLKNKTEADFEIVFSGCNDRIEAIFRFLAMLEMISEKLIGIKIGLGNNNFWIHGTPHKKEELETSS